MSISTPSRRLKALLLAIVLAAAGAIARADLRLVDPNPDDGKAVTFQGNGGYSADAIGQNTTGGTVQAEVPAGSTVVKAYLYAATYACASPPCTSVTVDFDGTQVTLTDLGSAHASLDAFRADVTTQVATKVGTGGGITNFAVNTDPANLDGIALVVIYSNPEMPFVSIALLDGGLSSTPNTTTVLFSPPIDKSLPGFAATLALGISFGAQDQPPDPAGSHLCGDNSQQDSQVDINGVRLTSCAGNNDDGVGTVANGVLITVGGVGDSTDNPSDPFQRAGDTETTVTPGVSSDVSDDELYNIAGFISTGDTQLTINTVNPSGDDQVFLMILSVTAQATVSGAEEDTATFTGNATQQRVDFFQNTANPVAFLIALPGFSGNVTFRAEQTTQEQLTADNKFANFPDAQCSQIGPNGTCVEICAVNPPPTVFPNGINGRIKWIQPAPYGNPQILHELSSVPGDAYDENATVPGTFNPLIDPTTPNDPVEDWESGGMSCWIVVDLPPFLTLPGNIETIATSPDGAVVNFVATASTAASDFGAAAAPIVSCASTSGLTSGSIFPIGTTTVTCSATSDTGRTGTASFDVTVLNAPPSGLVLNSGSVNENDSFTLDGSFTDPDGQAHAVRINWGDGSSPTVLSLAPGVLVFSASHQYLDDNPTGTPSDTYTVDVTVTDEMGASTTGSTFVVVANVPPVITGVTGPPGPLALGSVATVTATYTDVGTQDTHTCTFAWDDGSANTVVPGAGGSCSAAHTYTTAGVYTVGVTVTDDDTGSATTTFDFVVIFDPSAGFVTGGGWINSPPGAYTPNPSLSGKANFGFVSKYQKGATVPTGQTQFQLHVASFNFHSSVYEVLVVSGHKAQYRGSGTINGGGNYGFRLTAYDGQVSGGDGLDKFRIKIWDKATNVVIYDNRLGNPDDIDTADPQVIGGGSIVIHTGK